LLVRRLLLPHWLANLVNTFAARIAVAALWATVVRVFLAHSCSAVDALLRQVAFALNGLLRHSHFFAHEEMVRQKLISRCHSLQANKASGMFNFTHMA
jgi:hypothetical protein